MLTYCFMCVCVCVFMSSSSIISGSCLKLKMDLRELVVLQILVFWVVRAELDGHGQTVRPYDVSIQCCMNA